MKKSIFRRLTALLLLLVMLISVTSCFEEDMPDITITPNTPTDDPKDNPEHVCVFGEWNVIKEPTNTEDGLREKTCSCGKTVQEVIEASGKEYYIQYRNLKTAEYPEENGYNSKDGLLTLPTPEAEGYVFIGWYTASVGGELVDYIPEGSNKNYILYAHWDLVTYEITYKNVPNNTNVTSYDIEDKIKLETPKWSGLVFTHWSDENGNIYNPDENITVLPERMYGDLILTANWKVLRNIATPAADGAVLRSSYVSEQGIIYFVLELGTIEHVVLDNIYPEMYYKYEGMPINLTLSKTVSIGEETAQSIANTISQSISQTNSFSYAYNWGSENSLTQSADLSLSATAGKEGIFSVGVEATIGASSTGSSSYGHSNSRDFSSSSSSSSSKTIASSLAYKKEMTTEITENISIAASLPSGYYTYVHAANIGVYGVVTYDVATGNYYIDTYSRLENMHSMIMYYADVNQLNNPAIEALDFEMPYDKIKEYVNSAYYVEYDANGGNGRMPTTLHFAGEESKLSKNQFTKEGFLFNGWEVTTSEGIKTYHDEAVIKDLGSSLQTVTLKAIWVEDPNYDKDVVYTLTTKSGYVSKGVSGVTPNIKYSATIEYRNRTENSIEIRIVWKTTITDSYWTAYGQNLKFTIGSQTSSRLKLCGYQGLPKGNGNRSVTGTTGWMTVPLNTDGATSLNIKIYYWQTNSNDLDMYTYDKTAKVDTTWTVDIPAN